MLILCHAVDETSRTLDTSRLILDIFVVDKIIFRFC